MSLASLAGNLALGNLLDEVTQRFDGYQIIEHWEQGEYHHDLLIRVNSPRGLPGPVLLISTNCNAGVKEILCFADTFDRQAIWGHRCPGLPQFKAKLPPILGRIQTVYWIDPCSLLETGSS